MFLRAGQMAELDALRTEILGLSAKKIQTKVRSHVARKKYVMLQHFATQLQAVCRGTYIFIYIILHTNTISFPHEIGFKERESDFYPSIVEGTIARWRYETMRREAASLKIQTCYRKHCARKTYKEICSASTTIQSGLRGMAARHKLHFYRQTKAAVIIQVFTRFYFSQLS